MKIFAFVTIFLWSSLAIAEHCGEPGSKHWSTVVKLKAAPVTLHWTGVYEGADSVCSAVYKTSSGQSRTLEVWGQPEVNKAQSLLAFGSCADDGCEKEILVADIARGVVLKTKLPLTGPQSYLKAKWNATGRELLIEEKSFNVGQPLPARRFFCSVTKTVKCTSVESNKALHRPHDAPGERNR